MADITVILGPVPCRACRAPVVWGTADVRGSHGKINRWRDPATGNIHKCKRENQ